jgi:hypothetical protein
MSAFDSATSTLTVIGMALTGLSVVAGGWAVSRAASIKQTLDTVILGNNELRRVNDDLRAELAHERLQRVEDKAQARAEIARLEGQLQVLTGHMGDTIAAAVVHAMSNRSPITRTRKDDPT